jgi:hypothetical protein
MVVDVLHLMLLSHIFPVVRFISLLHGLLLEHENLLDLLRSQVLVDHLLFGGEAVVFDLLLATFNFKLTVLFDFFDLLNLVFILNLVLFIILVFVPRLHSLRKNLLQFFLWELEFVWVLFVLLL